MTDDQINKATRNWVNNFAEIPQSIIEKIVKSEQNARRQRNNKTH